MSTPTLQPDTLYRREGRKYVPIDHMVLTDRDRFDEGAWLVVVKRDGGCTSTLAGRVDGLDPDFIRLKAAAVSLQGELESLIYEASRCACPVPLTPKQAKAWRNLEDSGALRPIFRPSASAVAKQVLDVIVESTNRRTHGKATTNHRG